MILWRCDKCGKIAEAPVRTNKQAGGHRRLWLPEGWGQVCDFLRRDGSAVNLQTVCPDCVLTVAGLEDVPADEEYRHDVPGSVDFWVRVQPEDLVKLADGRLHRAMARRLFSWLKGNIPSGVYRQLEKMIEDEKTRGQDQDKRTAWSANG